MRQGLHGRARLRRRRAPASVILSAVSAPPSQRVLITDTDLFKSTNEAPASRGLQLTFLFAFLKMLIPWPAPKRPGLNGLGVARGVGPGGVGAEALQVT